VLMSLFSFFFAGCKKDDPKPSSTLQNDCTNQTYVAHLENRLAKLPDSAQVAIALIHDGGTEYLGVVNEGGTLKGTNNADKVFEIGSITKVFTGVALSALVTANEASLTETLGEQFDFPLQDGEDITFEQLANHTSGLPRLPTNVDEVQDLDLEDPYAVYTSENLRSYLENHLVLNAPSGTKYEYSNLGTGILGYSLAQKRNTTFEDLLQSIVFRPLAMNSSTTVLANVDPSRLVEPRDINGNLVSHWNFTEPVTAAGSIKSSVADLVKFMEQNFADDAVYNLPKEKTFDRGNGLHMGLGWVIFEQGDYVINTHDGGTGGFSSILMLDKGKRIGVVVLSNVEDFHDSISPLCNDLILVIDN
ncbi:MAG: serine hydrolase domain-containing protein, partial [Bacteroidota bacterium]